MRTDSVGVTSSPGPDRQALIRTIEALEGQRSTLGDGAVDLAIAPLRARLVEHGSDRVAPAVAVKRGGERKIVTVVFADIAGFTTMSERIGSEASLDIVNSLFDRLVPIVQRYGGVVDKFIGDEIMAVFGAPRTVERHAEYALRAVLAMFAAVDDYNRENGFDLALHAGVNTGEVVAGDVGSSGRHDYSVTGDTVNVAARLESAAQRGEIVVGPSTYRHTFQLFAFESLEPLALKGKARPLPAYRVLGPLPRRSRVRAEGLHLPFAGRETELGRLLDHLRGQGSDHRGAVFVRAEPGLGKSRLITELRDRAGDVRWLDAAGEDFRSEVSYGVVHDLLDGLVGAREVPDRDKILQAYDDYLDGIGSERARLAKPYLLRLRGLPLDDADEAAVAVLGGDALRQRLTQAVADLLATVAQPAVVCIEDAHWADPSSLSLVRALADDAGLGNVLFVLTTRPDAAAASRWVDEATVVNRVLDLKPLSDAASRALLDDAFAGGGTPALVEEIGAKAHGNPLYLASLLRSLVDSGVASLANGRISVDGPVPSLAIPDTLQTVIGSQIDRLPARGKKLLHLASILGIAFASREAVRMAQVEGVADDVGETLALLQQRQLLGVDADDRLRFTHALVRDVAYHQLLERERRRLHGIATSLLEEDLALVADPSEAVVALLASHYERAGDNDRASHRYEQAALLAAAGHAHAEELGYLESAIRLAPAHGDHRLIGLHERAGDALQLLARYAEAGERFQSVLASNETFSAIERARFHRKVARSWTPRMTAEPANRAIGEARRALAAGEPRNDAWWREHFELELLAMWALYMQGDVEGVATIAASLEPQIDAQGTLKERGIFHRNLGLLLLRQQRYKVDAESVELASQAAEELRGCGDTAAYCLATFSLAFMQLWSGRLQTAEQTMQRVLDETVKLGDAERNLLCLVYLAIVHRQLANVDSAEAFAKAAIARARANRSPHYEAVAQGALAWVAWKRDDGALADRLVDLAQQSTIPHYPFAWIHAAVALARAVERGDIETATVMVRRMLEPSHQGLDADAQAIFEDAATRPSVATMQCVIDACRRIGYL
ncbi:MAG TPA: adenylate/guanylate cyclase domain-containing protein [Casimicrobiaceae bacterium]|nr:adenylate/guanylate cyclase domain-containing protein [Casimicrobiaceae bacterium]